MQQPTKIIIPSEFFDGIVKVGLYLPQELEVLNQDLFNYFIQKIGAWQANTAPQQNLINAKVRKEVNKENFKEIITEIFDKWLNQNSFSEITPILSMEEQADIESFVRIVFKEPKRFQLDLVFKLMNLYDKLCRSNRGTAQVESRANVKIILLELAKSSVYLSYDRHKPLEQKKTYSFAIDQCVQHKQRNEDSLQVMQILNIADEKFLLDELIKLMKILNETNTSQQMKQDKLMTVGSVSFHIVEKIIHGMHQFYQQQNVSYNKINILSQIIKILSSDSQFQEQGFQEVVLIENAYRVFQEDSTYLEFIEIYKSNQQSIKGSLQMIIKRIKEGKERHHNKLNSREILSSLIRSGFYSKENEDNLKIITSELRQFHNKNQVQIPLNQPSKIPINGQDQLNQLEKDLIKIFQSPSHRNEILLNYKEYMHHIPHYQLKQGNIIFTRQDGILILVQKNPSQETLLYMLLNSSREKELQRSQVVESFKEAIKKQF